jgi:hypothetical protein
MSKPSKVAEYLAEAERLAALIDAYRAAKPARCDRASIDPVAKQVFADCPDRGTTAAVGGFRSSRFGGL